MSTSSSVVGRPDELCACGEVAILEVQRHSGWGDLEERGCVWCFGGGIEPGHVRAIWLDGDRRTGDAHLLAQLFIVAFRRVAARRVPDLELRSHDEAAELWASLSGVEARGWEGRVAPVWCLLMLNPHLTEHQARDYLTRHAGRFPRDTVVHARQWTGPPPAGLLELTHETARLGRLADLVEGGGWLPLPPEPALSPQDTRRVSALQKGRWMALHWSLDMLADARGLVRGTDRLREVPGATEAEVLQARIAVKIVHAILLIVDSPADVRPSLALWFADQLRAAHIDDVPTRTLQMLPDGQQVLWMAERLREQPDV